MIFLKVAGSKEIQSESSTPVVQVALDRVLLHRIPCLLWEKHDIETGISFTEILKKIDGESRTARKELFQWDDPCPLMQNLLYSHDQGRWTYTQLNKLWLQELKLPLQQLFLIHHIPLPPPIPPNVLGFKCVSEMVFLMSWSSSLFLLLFAYFKKQVYYSALLISTGFVLLAPHQLHFPKIHPIACQMGYKTHVMYIISYSSHGSV